MRIKDEQQSKESRSSFSPSRGKGRGSFRDRHDAGTRRNNARHPRLPRAAGARRNDSMAPRVRIPTRHELPNDASLLSAPLPSRRAGTWRGETTKDRERERESRIPHFSTDIERWNREYVETRGTRPLEAFWIAWKARIPVVNRYCERTVYGLLCVYRVSRAFDLSRINTFRKEQMSK